MAQHWLGMDEEREFLRFVRNNHLPLFPRLVAQSQFNRRACSLCWLIQRMRQHLVAQMDIAASPCQLIDGTPVSVRHWFGAPLALLRQRASAPAGSGPGLLRGQEANLLKKLTYYGFRLLAVTTLEGIIVDWDLFAANTDEHETDEHETDERETDERETDERETDEREGALDLLENSRNLSVLGDKGFLDQWRQSVGVRVFFEKSKACSC